MKYGTSKYNKTKYGIYNEVTGLIIYGPISKSRIRTGSNTYITQTISCPICKKIRINGTIAYTFAINGCYNKIRVKSSTNTIIAKVVTQ